MAKASRIEELRADLAQLELERVDIKVRLAAAEKQGDDQESMCLLVEDTIRAFASMDIEAQIKALTTQSRSNLPDEGMVLPPGALLSKAVATKRARSQGGRPVRVSVPEATLARLDAMAARLGVERSALVQLAVFQTLVGNA